MSERLDFGGPSVVQRPVLPHETGLFGADVVPVVALVPPLLPDELVLAGEMTSGGYGFKSREPSARVNGTEVNLDPQGL